VGAVVAGEVATSGSTPSRPWSMPANWNLNALRRDRRLASRQPWVSESRLVSALSEEFILRLELKKCRLDTGQLPL
jgi:hypothetical protein